MRWCERTCADGVDPQPRRSPGTRPTSARTSSCRSSATCRSGRASVQRGRCRTPPQRRRSYFTSAGANVGRSKEMGHLSLFWVRTQYDMASSSTGARWETLAERATAAREQAAAAVRRADELQALIDSVRRGEAICCAWCGRIAPRWTAYVVTPAHPAKERYFRWQLTPSARKRLTHGICPSCYERVTSSAAIERAAARPDDSPA